MIVFEKPTYSEENRFKSELSTVARVELIKHLEELRQERHLRATDGGHTAEDLRFIDGWIQAIEWVLGTDYSFEAVE